MINKTLKKLSANVKESFDTAWHLDVLKEREVNPNKKYISLKQHMKFMV